MRNCVRERSVWRIDRISVRFLELDSPLPVVVVVVE